MIAVGGKSMYFVYVVGRSDGLHKIGVTGHVLDRCEALSKLSIALERYGYEKARRIGMTAMVGGKDKTKIRNATPVAFRDVLLSIARTAVYEMAV